MTAPVVLTQYPLPRDLREQIERALGAPPVYRNLGELRRLPVLGMIRALRPDAGQCCVIPLDDVAARSFVPVLHALAAVAGFRRVEVMSPDGSDREGLAAWRAPEAVAAVLGASATSALAVRIARRELAGLLAAERIDGHPRDTSRALHLNANLWFGVNVGGSVGHIAGVANALAASGYAVDVASLSPPSTLNIGVRRLALKPPGALGLPFENNSYRFGRNVARQLRGVLQAQPVRFIYQRMSLGNYSGVVLSRHTRTPLVLEYNGSEAWASKHWGRPLRRHELAVCAESACIRHASLIVTVSEVLRDELLDRGVEADRVVWYPNGIDPEMFDPARYDEAARLRLRDELKIAPDEVVVTFIGTFGQWHGVEVLARAIAGLAAQRTDWLTRRRVRFLIVGDGIKSPEVQQILDGEPRCAPFVVRTGLIPQALAPAYLAASDLLVSPHVRNPDGSRFFGSPTKLFEYMAMGKAIVASDLEQIGEVLRPGLRANDLPVSDSPTPGGHLALLTEPGNVEQLTAGIAFLVESPGWREALGVGARARALERYTWRDHVGAILDGLETVLASGAHRPQAPSPL